MVKNKYVLFKLFYINCESTLLRGSVWNIYFIDIYLTT